MAEKISGVYKITNTVTNDFYIGSSKDVKLRLASHKWPSSWKQHPNSPMYLDMKRYGLDYFVFEILAEVEPEHLKEKEQQFIETLHPTYNSNRANGWNIDKYKKYQKEYMKEYMKEYQKEYRQSEKGKESQRKANNKYYKQLCYYNNETLTLRALSTRFYRAGIKHPAIEAKKYLLKKEPENVIEFYDIYP